MTSRGCRFYDGNRKWISDLTYSSINQLIKWWQKNLVIILKNLEGSSHDSFWIYSFRQTADWNWRGVDSFLNPGGLAVVWGADYGSNRVNWSAKFRGGSAPPPRHPSSYTSEFVSDQGFEIYVRAAEPKRVNPKSARRLRCASLGSIADMKMKVEISCFTFTNFRDDELLF